MIQFSRGLGNHGRLGNIMFQLATLNSFSKRYNTEWCIPPWEHSHLFETKFPENSRISPSDLVVNERKFTYDQEYFDEYKNDFKYKNVDILGYFQSTKYFDEATTRKLLSFKPEVIENIRKKYKQLFTKPTISVGIRRGDYVNNPNYVNLPPLYYILSLQKFDYHNYNIVFHSDDLQYCWFHFKCLPNALFPKFDSDIEAFICGTLSDNWIIANSTFHFWSAYLSNSEKIIQPSKLFSGDLLSREGDVNFYLENDRFEIFDYEN